MAGFMDRSWVCYGRYHFYGISGVRLRVAMYRTGVANVRSGGLNGTLVASFSLTPSAKNGTIRQFSTLEQSLRDLESVPATGPLCIQFFGVLGSGVVADLNWFELIGPGASLSPNFPLTPRGGTQSEPPRSPASLPARLTPPRTPANAAPQTELLLVVQLLHFVVSQLALTYWSWLTLGFWNKAPSFDYVRNVKCT